MHGSDSSSGPHTPTLTGVVPLELDARTRSEGFTTDPLPPVEVHQQFGRFEIVDVLGTGGMGTVFEARDTTLDRTIALKLLHPDVAQRSERRLLREAKALARLSHPNVVQVFEAGVVEGRAFIAMERVRGRDLARWQAEARPWRECVEVYLQAARGLAAAHDQGLVHRDFKPSNCILDATGRVRVLDFGLARPLGAHHPPSLSVSLDPEPKPENEHENEAPVLQARQRITGTLGYMPLEQLWHQPLDAHSDQFSLCVSLFEAVYRQRPFSGASLDQLIDRMLEGQIDRTPEPPRVPRRLRRLLERGLHARPEQRWPSMEALIVELETLLRPRRHRRAWGLAAVGGVVVATAAWWGLRDTPCRDPRAALAEAWDPLRREQVSEALSRADDPELAAERLGRLDAHAEAWIDQQRAVCEAERDGATDPTQLAVRQTCLAESREELRELGGLLAEAEPDAVADTAKRLDALLDPERCAQPERFQSPRPLPPPAQAERARALRRQLARRYVRLTAGDANRALEGFEPELAAAKDLGFGPVLAEYEHFYGSALADEGHYTEANEHLERAYALALEHEYAQAELKASNALAYLVGDLLDQHDTGLKWGLTAEARARQPWVDPAMRHYTTELVANIYYEQGRFSQALERYRRSLDTRERLDPNDPMLPLSRANIALVLYEQGRYEQALPLLYAVLDQRLADAHPFDPGIAHARLRLSMALHQLGRDDEARPLLFAALDTYETTYGPDHPGVLAVLTELGRLRLDGGDLPGALAAYERAQSIAHRTLGPTHSHAAETWLGIAEILVGHGQLDAARRHAIRGLRISEQALGSRHIHTGAALALLGRVEYARGDRSAARDALERAVDVLEAGEGPPQQLAEARFALAIVLSTYPAERDATRQLARRAAQAYAELGPRGRPRAEVITTWQRRLEARIAAPAGAADPGAPRPAPDQ